MTVQVFLACCIIFVLGRLAAYWLMWRRDRQPEIVLTVLSTVGFMEGSVLRVGTELWRIKKLKATSMHCQLLTPEAALWHRLRGAVRRRR